MPLTYVAHQVPALALKLGRPRWFDGTALALGSMSPDWAYALQGSRFAVDAHGAAGLLLVAVPAAAAAALATRRLAPAVAGHLPEPPGLPLRRLRALGARRPPLALTVVSALVGALSHVGWDTFTHPGAWGARVVPWLGATHDVAGHAVPGAKLAQLTSTSLGFVVGLVLLALVLRRLPEAGGRQPRGTRRFWASVVAGAAAGAAWSLDPGPAYLAVPTIRVSLCVAAGAALGALLATGRHPGCGRRRRAATPRPAPAAPE